MESITKEYLTAKYDISGIQDYIFASSRLRENAGASYNVSYALKELLPEVIRKAAQEEPNCPVGKQEGVRVITDWRENRKMMITDPGVLAEVVYIGGGNAMVLFQEESFYRKVTAELNRRLAMECEGLYLASAFVETDLQSFSEDYNRLNQRIAQVKNTRRPQVLHPFFPVACQDPADGLPITRRSAAGPKTEWTDKQYQKEMAFRRYHGADAPGTCEGQEGQAQELCTEFDACLPDGYEYAVEMEDLGEMRGEDSNVAIVHIDGNGMGSYIQKKFEEQGACLTGLPEIRKASLKVSQTFTKAFEAVIRLLVSDQKIREDNPQTGHQERQEKSTRLPLRPLIMDGDDLTLICKASLALPVSAAFMKALLKEQDDELPVTACAGIAFVHSHFPFRLGYEIAEECCSLAKRVWYEKSKDTKDRNCWLDFRVIQDAGLDYDAVNTMENRYKQNGKQLMLRPYRLLSDNSGTDGDILSLKSLCGIVKRMENWPHNRLERLYHAFRISETEVGLLDKEFFSRGYDLSSLAGVELEEGFDKSGNTPLFDALELRDLCDCGLLEKCLSEM